MLIGYEFNPRLREEVLRLFGEETELVPPGITVQSDRPEWRFLGRETLGCGFGQSTGAAGTLPQVGLFNFVPATIGVVTIVRMEITVVNTLVYRFFRGTRATAIAAGFGQGGCTAGPADTRDPRLIVQSTALEILQVPLAAPSGGNGFDVFAPPAANVSVTDDAGGIVLAPNTGLIINSGAVGVQTLLVAFRWYERGVRPEELAV